MKKYNQDNLNFEIKKLNNPNIIKTFSPITCGNRDLSIIISQKTNSVEGNTTNLIDAKKIIENETTLGTYRVTEKLEVKNLFEIYLDMLKDPNKKFRDKQIHFNMYNKIIDITFKPGDYKTKNNYTTIINKDNKYINTMYIDHKETSKLLKLNKSYLSQIEKLDNTTDKLINLFIWHCNFETIHPFADGNGRVGRFLLDQQLIKLNLPPLILSNDYKNIYFEINNIIRESKFDNELIVLINILLEKSFNEYKQSIIKILETNENTVTFESPNPFM